MSKLSTRYKNTAFSRALGEHCRRLRIQKGFSIDRVAKEGDKLSPAAIQRLETGEADVQVSILLRLADVLEVPLKKLFDFNYSESQNEKLILPFEEKEKPPAHAVPFYSIEVAAGALNHESEADSPEGWVIVNKKGSLKDYFAVRILGKSMEPTIPDMSICLFKKYTGGSRSGQIMLIQARGVRDPENGGKFVVKRYQRITPHIIHLLSDNPKFPPIVLKNISDEEVSTPAIFVEVITNNKKP